MLVKKIFCVGVTKNSIIGHDRSLVKTFRQEISEFSFLAVIFRKFHKNRNVNGNFRV